MFLKNLKIQGFKSFSEKVKLDFKEGITAIVGPNGSGKSNISDAIRWVLGEQSAKTLRGDKMEDIIFAGTKNRKPLGFAEVSITFDNSDKKLNIEFSEITITRKVFRSGESGYYINGSICRLKDIHELFMDTGIGKEGYSIIGQGKIDAILSNKSEDRRALFEEAVGIVKFKNRRLQAENRLEEVRKNLIRTNDIILELEKQLKPLEIQQQKAKEYLILENKLKLIKVNLFKKEYKISEDEIKKIDEDINILLEDINRFENDKQDIIKKQDFLRQKLIKNDDDNKNLNEVISNILLDIEKEESEIKLDLRNIDFIKTEIERLKKENLYFEDILEKKQEEINFINVSLEGNKLEYCLKNEKLKVFLEQFEDIKNKTNKSEEIIKKYNVEIVEKMSLHSELKNKLSFYENSRKQFEHRKENIILEINSYNSKLNEKIIRKKVLTKELEQLNQDDSKIKFELEKSDILFKQLEGEILNIKNEFSNKNKVILELKNKEKILTELEKDYEGYFNSVKAILKEKENNVKFSGIYGAIGEIIEVSKKYETAIEIALGNSIQNIVTKNEEDGKIAINYLKNNNKGRATFLPLTSIKSKKIENLQQLKNEKGFIGIANELINFEEIFYNVISNLLGRTIIVDNIDNAIFIAKKYNYIYKIVTLDGQIINSGGALTGGSVSKKIGGIFSRNREIQNIKQDILIIENDINIINKKENELNEKRKNILDDINLKQQNIKSIFEKITSIKYEINQNEIYIKDISEKIISLEKEQEIIKNQVDLEQEKIIFNQLENVNQEISNLKLELLKFEDELEKGKTNKEVRFNEINELKIQISSIKNEIDNKQKDIFRIKEEIEQSKKRHIDFEKEVEIKENEKYEISIKIADKNKHILRLKQDYNILKEKYNIINEEKIKINEDIEKYSNLILNIIKDIGELNNQITKIEAKKENIDNKLERFIELMWEDYKITYAEACNDYENLDLCYDELKKEEKTLKSQINLLGVINVSAIEEYKMVKERYEFNISQREDILKADDDLKNIISTLIKEMENQFKEQFNLINKNFKEVFSDMFGGGTAKLTLTDEDNILTSGIEIVAQPTGKNLQSLTLLSGGERTLTAMSLLFAILKMKPSPFCILDETEAALDDANVTRYANFLKKFSKDNQFILITHKTGTMEVADVLYGVTMEEQGISKVISVQLKDAKGYDKNLNKRRI